MKHDYLLRHIQDEELSQAVARIAIMGILTIVLTPFYLFGSLTVHAPAISGAYFAFGVVWAALIHRFPGDFIARRVIAIVADLATLSLAMYFVNSLGTALYPLYLWVIVGNGMRFGPQSLLISMVIGLCGFLTSVSLSSYWSQNIPGAIGLASGMIVLPLFYLVLIKRLHLLNDRLVQQLDQTLYAATHDGLTELANRGYFFQRIEEEIGAGERYQHRFAILFIDLDGFKDINDTYGHNYGDETLKIVAGRLKDFVRKSDIICRLGGDEFGLLLHGLHNPEDLRELSQKLIRLLSEPMTINTQVVHVTASIGISLFPNHGSTPDELINKADQAMYRAKNKGKNRYTFYLEEVATS
ncbi:MAG: GGDEF domain-containing protein [Gammaproteobacteria bacterium]|jgi:diguanylate cyclase (GGDEF)-like protein